MFYVYILWSEKTQKFYCGYTSNMDSRLKRHNSGWEKSTRYGTPWRIIWRTEKASRSEAMELEKKLKSLTQKRLIQFIRKYSEGVAGPDEFLLLEKLSGC